MPIKVLKHSRSKSKQNSPNIFGAKNFGTDILRTLETQRTVFLVGHGVRIMSVMLAWIDRKVHSRWLREKTAIHDDPI